MIWDVYIYIKLVSSALYSLICFWGWRLYLNTSIGVRFCILEIMIFFLCFCPTSSSHHASVLILHGSLCALTNFSVGVFFVSFLQTFSIVTKKTKKKHDHICICKPQIYICAHYINVWRKFFFFLRWKCEIATLFLTRHAPV